MKTSGKAHKTQVCPVSSIHTLVTELPPDDPILQPYANAGIELR